MFHNIGYNINISSCFYQDAYYDTAQPNSQYANYYSSNVFERNLYMNHKNLTMLPCVVCLLPIESNWNANTIQLHPTCYKHVFDEAINLRTENNHLKNQITGLHSHLENMIFRANPQETRSNDPNRSISQELNGYKCNGKTIKSNYSTIYSKDDQSCNKTINYQVAIGNLPENDLISTRAALKRQFSEYGSINKIWINPINKLYGFIEFEDQVSAKEAAEKMSGKNFLGKMLEVKMQGSHLSKSSCNTSDVCELTLIENTIKETLSSDTDSNEDSPQLQNDPVNFNEEVKECLVENKEELRNKLDTTNQEKKILNLRLIVDSQKQVIMKYRNNLKIYEEKFDQLSLISSDSSANVSIPQINSKEQVLNRISREIRKNIGSIRKENSNR